MPPRRRLAPLALLALALPALADALDAPGQPARQNAPLGQYDIVGNTLVSAQQLFLGTEQNLFVIDKVENNAAQLDGHPAWASRYALASNKGTAMDAITNTFCAGGGVLANGSWLVVGGNQAVTTGGDPASSQNGGAAPYHDPDGGKSLRLLTPCDDDSCQWELVGQMSTRRWYASVETLDDGRVIIMGGDANGGFVNDAGQTNPTYEFFPAAAGDQPVTSPLLQRTLPANLFPLMWVLPSARLFVQANFGTAILDYKAQQEFQLPDMPHAVRTYPASGGTAMLPLTPANNWTATILFCSGMNVSPSDWDPNAAWPTKATSKSCVRITPDVSQNYEEDDDVPSPRSMGNMILLPTGKILYLNGAQTGVAGYGTGSNTVGDSYADNPAFQPWLYDPDAPSGKRWSMDGLSPSTIARMYHSSATLLPDGSVAVAGSSPHPDVVLTGTKFPTEYRIEIIYPSYYNTRRPEPQGIPASIGYGGAFFNLTLSAADLGNDVTNLNRTSVVLVRTGYSTHALNMQQRMLVLENTYTGAADASGTLHVAPVPPNPALFPPGPALLFVVVDGTPSVARLVNVGSGAIGTQPTRPPVPLPGSRVLAAAGSSSSSAPAAGATGDGTKVHAASAAPRAWGLSGLWAAVLAPLAFAGVLLPL
ncbi:glyoxal oxidase and galactose oxidase domain-containing protein [Phanerochaete sordida]|uniref:Glyoxal oxidase and galactose oxidase domain-containing protein n=1 Tax=Phanerochaete sordida TaxID=48140 RepID=A0A9P3LHQ5_9APHY|nr:glyoxal oxidase and galactose oxidase domain-containing protein [Phanerochaete sordida]